MNDDARLDQWVASHRGELGAGSPSAHVDVETLARHATGQLSPARAHAVTEHLVACEDGRCVAFLRAQAADVEGAASMLYPKHDASVSHARTFQCRPAIWSMFEAAAEEMRVPIDDLVNEAMLAYARSRGHEVPMQSSPLDVTQDARSAAALMAPPPRAPAPAPAPASRMRAAAARPAAAAPPPPASRRAPPPLPSSPMAPPSMSLAKRLTLAFEGRTYAVDKEHFIIGRSKTQADLRIDDPNVSRQHASIERIGSIYYLVDLGSTNGVYVADDKVTRRALADGDVIVVTTHRIHCTLR